MKQNIFVSVLKTLLIQPLKFQFQFILVYITLGAEKVQFLGNLMSMLNVPPAYGIPSGPLIIAFHLNKSFQSLPKYVSTYSNIIVEKHKIVIIVVLNIGKTY